MARLKASGGRYYFTTDAEDIIQEVLSLSSEKHPYQTLIIDPATVPYAEELDKAAKEVGTDFGRHKVPADRIMKHLLTLILRLPMNVIMTSHAKPNWERAKDQKGRDTVVEAGKTFDCYARLDYMFDLVVEVQMRGGDRIAVVRKSRLEQFPVNSEFPFCYEEIAKRYGRDMLERDAAPVELATDEQAREIEELLSVRTDADTLRGRWLAKAEAESWAEMHKTIIEKCITFLKEGKK